VKIQLAITLKRQATKTLTQLVKDKSPVLVTQHGVPAAYLVDVVSFEALQSRLQILEGIARGEWAIQEGRIFTHLQANRCLHRSYFARRATRSKRIIPISTRQSKIS
jgi:prevent-host-death family protein